MYSHPLQNDPVHPSNPHLSFLNGDETNYSVFHTIWNTFIIVIVERLKHRDLIILQFSMCTKFVNYSDSLFFKFQQLTVTLKYRSIFKE